MAYLPDVDVSIPAGHELEVRIVIDDISGDKMMLAYDTVSFPSLITPAYVPPAADTAIYIHNSSTPPTGDTNSQTLLMMSTTTPTTTISLPNYDQDRDADDGLLLNKTDLGLSESDATKFQEWRASSTSTIALEGDVVIEIWAAIKDYGDGKRGVLTVFLRDRNPSGPSFNEIGNATVYDADWQEGALDFIKTTLIIPGVNYTVPSGNQLVARLVVDNNSDDAMWIAYDTVAYKSVIKLALGPPPSEAGTIAADNFESGDLGGGTGWLDATWITSGTVLATSANSPQQGTFHMQVDRNSEADRTTDMTGQTSPRLQFWGRVDGLTGVRQAHAEVSSDGLAFTIVKTVDERRQCRSLRVRGYRSVVVHHVQPVLVPLQRGRGWPPRLSPVRRRREGPTIGLQRFGRLAVVDQDSTNVITGLVH